MSISNSYLNELFAVSRFALDFPELVPLWESAGLKKAGVYVITSAKCYVIMNIINIAECFYQKTYKFVLLSKYYLYI